MKMNGGHIPVLPFKKNKKFHLAIRIEYKTIQREIKSKVIVSNKINGKSAEYTAVWDTGATNTGISHKVFNELGLIPIDKSYIRAVNNISESDIALIDLEFLENLKIRLTKTIVQPKESIAFPTLLTASKFPFVISQNTGLSCGSKPTTL